MPKSLITKRRWTILSLLLAAALLGGCSTDPEEAPASPTGTASEEYVRYKAEALRVYDQGRVGDATKAIARAISVAPYEREPYELFTRFHMEIGADADAAQAYAYLASGIPDAPWIWYYAGVHLGRLGQWEESLAAFDRAAALWAEDHETRREAADVQDQRGLVLHTLGRGDEALDAFRTARTLDPAATGAASHLAEALLESGDVDGAEQVVVEGLAVNPGSGPLLHLLGRVLVERGRAEEAEQALEDALVVNPTDAGAHRLLGRLYTESGRRTEGAQQVRMARRIEDYREGVVDLARAARADEEDPKPVLAMAELEISEGKYRNALRWLAAAETREGDAERIGLARALAYYAIGDMESGDGELGALAEPSGSPGRYHLARAARLIANGEEDLGRETLTRALNEGPNEREFLWIVSDLFGALGDIGRSETIRERAADAPRAGR